MKNVAVTPGQQLSVVVGSGGTVGAFSWMLGGYSIAGGSGICIVRWTKDYFK